MKIHHLLSISLLLIGCSCSPSPEHPDPVSGSEYCDEAQFNLEQLNCLNPDNTPMWINADGEEFADTCLRIQEEGGIFIDPKCISEAESCEEADNCPIR